MANSEVVIEFRNVTKSFTVVRGGARHLKHHLIKIFHPKAYQKHKESRVVLNNVDFNIYKGEFVGIMGRNGVGKSTMLKMISGIYRPNSGYIRSHGRMAPVLELGAGFADELSGYENIALNASILGYSRKQLAEHIDKIVEFSELKDQIFDPVRNYSSGMLVRLAFSIACHVDAEILLFDEVLAVGDIVFQSKCLAKIKELNASGASIILVSHSPSQIADHCGRCILLDGSKKVLMDQQKKARKNTQSSLASTWKKTESLLS